GAEEAVDAGGEQAADRARLAIAADDVVVADQSAGPAALEPQPVLLQRVPTRREALDHPQRAQEGQRQDEQARIAGAGDERDRQEEGAAEAEPDSHHPGEESLLA